MTSSQLSLHLVFPNFIFGPVVQSWNLLVVFDCSRYLSSHTDSVVGIYSPHSPRKHFSLFHTWRLPISWHPRSVSCPDNCPSLSSCPLTVIFSILLSSYATQLIGHSTYPFRNLPFIFMLNFMALCDLITTYPSKLFFHCSPRTFSTRDTLFGLCLLILFF